MILLSDFDNWTWNFSWTWNWMGKKETPHHLLKMESGLWKVILPLGFVRYAKQWSDSDHDHIRNQKYSSFVNSWFVVSISKNTFITSIYYILVQGMGCDWFLGRTHAPHTSRLRCARTRVRTPNLKWSHFPPAHALLVK